MNRRELLQCAALLVAGSAVPRSWSITAEQSKYLAARESYITTDASFFTAAQRDIVTAIAEHVIPRTDTAGAIDAGVPRFIELMTADWFTDSEREFFMQGLAQVEQQGFASKTKAEQLSYLEELEAAAGDSSWYSFGNVLRVWQDDAPFICQIKELTVLGYFLSDVGIKATQRVNPMGSFKGDIPWQEGDKTYAIAKPYRS